MCTKHGSEDKPSPSISSQFSAGVERLTINDRGEEHRIGAELYVDFDSDIYRMDMTQPMQDKDNKQFGAVPVKMIYDFQSGKAMWVICRFYYTQPTISFRWVWGGGGYISITLSVC